MAAFIERVLAFLAKGSPIIVATVPELLLVAAAIAAFSILYVVTVGYCFPALRENSVLFFGGLVFALTAGYLVIYEVCGHCMPSPGDIFQRAPEAAPGPDTARPTFPPRLPDPKTCLSFQHYDAIRDECVANNRVPTIGQPSPATNQKTCPFAFEHYDAIKGDCVVNIPKTCPLFQHYDVFQDTCIPNIGKTCPSSQHYDFITNLCVFDIPTPR